MEKNFNVNVWARKAEAKMKELKCEHIQIGNFKDNWFYSERMDWAIDDIEKYYGRDGWTEIMTEYIKDVERWLEVAELCKTGEEVEIIILATNVKTKIKKGLAKMAVDNGDAIYA